MDRDAAAEHLHRAVRVLTDADHEHDLVGVLVDVDEDSLTVQGISNGAQFRVSLDDVREIW